MAPATRALGMFLLLCTAALAGCTEAPVEAPAPPRGVEVHDVAIDPPSFLRMGEPFHVTGRLLNTGDHVAEVALGLHLDGVAVAPPRAYTLWPGDQQDFDLVHRPAEQGSFDVQLVASHGFTWEARLHVGAPRIRIEALEVEPASVALGGQARVLLRLFNAGTIPGSVDVHVLLNAETLAREQGLALAQGATVERTYPVDARKEGANEVKVLLSGGGDAVATFRVVVPDLRIQRWLPDRVDCEVRVTVTLVNEGRDPAQQVRMSIQIIEEGGRVSDSATRELGDLAAGASVDANAALRLSPGCHREDMYQLRIRAEAANAEPILLETPPRI